MQSVSEIGSPNNTIRVDFAVDDLAQMIERVLRVKCRNPESFQLYEQCGQQLCNEALRRVLEKQLQEKSDSLTEELMIDGDLYRRHEPGKVNYHSLCGPLRVERSTYREVGVRNGPTVVPLEVMAGLMHHATPALASAVGRGYADRTSRQLSEDLLAAGRKPPSRSTIERMAVSIGTEVKAAVGKIEPALRRRETLPAEARAVTVGLDRTTVPMLEQISEDKWAVQYRMAYVGTVCITDGDVEPLQTRRYAAPAHEGPQQLVSRIEADLRRVLAQRPELTVAVVQDGAPELWGLMWTLLDELGIKKRAIDRIDRYHASQYLSGALDALRVPEPTRSKILDRWNDDLDKRNGAIHRINAEIEEMQRGLPDKVQRELSRYTTYLFCNAYRIRYATLHKLGVPQGSGVTEGACKSLITMRTKRSGQRWSRHGIESVLAIRSVVHSDRWNRFWKSFARSNRKTLDLIRA